MTRKFKENDLVVLNKSIYVSSLNDYLKAEYIYSFNNIKNIIKDYATLLVTNQKSYISNMELKAGSVGIVCGYEFIPARIHKVHKTLLTADDIVISSLSDGEESSCFRKTERFIKVLFDKRIIFFMSSHMLSLAGKEKGNFDVDITIRLNLRNVDKLHAQKIIDSIILRNSASNLPSAPSTAVKSIKISGNNKKIVDTLAEVYKDDKEAKV